LTYPTSKISTLLIKLTALTLTERVLESKHLNGRSLSNQTLLPTKQAHNYNPNDNNKPNDNILRTKLIQKISSRLIKLITLALTERILESKHLNGRSLSNQTLLSTKQAYNYNPNGNYKPNDNIL
jgi:hypothetical protein